MDGRPDGPDEPLESLNIGPEIEPAPEDRGVRPLLDCPRAEIVGVHSIRHDVDATNARDPSCRPTIAIGHDPDTIDAPGECLLVDALYRRVMWGLTLVSTRKPIERSERSVRGATP